MSAPYDPQQPQQPVGAGQPATGGFPAAGQGAGFPNAGQGAGFPNAPQGQGFPPGQQYPMAPGNPIGMGPKRGKGRLFLRIGIAVVVVIVAIVGYSIYSHTDPTAASVGQCLSGDLNNAESVQQTDCTNTNANYKVLATLDNKSEADYNDDKVCSDVNGADAVFWEGHENKSDGTILCLEDLHGAALAKTGDCLSGDDASSTQIVSCTASGASYKVLEVLPNKTKADYDSDSVCSDVDADQVLWANGGSQTTAPILCLKSLS